MVGVEVGGLQDEEREFLERLAAHVRRARREGAVVGSLYTLGVLACAASAWWLRHDAAAIFPMAIGGALVMDAWRRFGRFPE